ncbi:hypothetical protein FB446DRAFT_740947, partial [Lentinula raphanica]
MRLSEALWLKLKASSDGMSAIKQRASGSSLSFLTHISLPSSAVTFVMPSLMITPTMTSCGVALPSEVLDGLALGFLGFSSLCSVGCTESSLSDAPASLDGLTLGFLGFFKLCSVGRAEASLSNAPASLDACSVGCAEASLSDADNLNLAALNLSD